MALKFRRGTTAQKSGSLAFGEPYVNTSLGTLQIGLDTGDVTLATTGTGSSGNFGAISGTSLSITGNASIDGNLTLGGTITIGDNTSDNVVVNADLSSSIIPNNDNAFDLGSTSSRYRAIYGANLYGAINATNGVVSGSSQVVGILSSLNTYTGSNDTTNTLQTTRIDQLAAGTASVNSFTSSQSTTNTANTARFQRLEESTASLNAFSASENTKSETLRLYTASVDTKFAAVQASTASLNAYTASNDTTNTSQNNRLTRLEESTASLNAFSASENTKSETLRLYTASIDAKFSTLATYTASVDTTNTAQNNRLSRLEESTSSLNAYTASNNTTNTLQTTRIDQLAAGTASVNLQTASVAGHITDINTYTSSLKTAIAVSGADLTVLGNLTVQGDTVTLNVSNLLVEDKVIEIASGSTTSAAANGAGIFISGANASILWDNAASTLDINKSIDVAGNITLTGTVDGVDVSLQDTLYTNKFSTLQTYTASVDSTLARLRESTASLNVFSASENTKSETLRLYTASIDSKFGTLATYTGSNDTTNTTQNTRLSRLEESTSSLNAFTSSQATTNTANTARFTRIEESTASLNVFSASENTKSETLRLYTASVDTKFSTLATYTGSNDTTNTTQNTRLTRLEESTSSLNTLTASLATTYEGRASAAKVLVSGSSQVNFTQLSGISANIISGSTNSTNVNFTISGGSITANLIGGVVSGSSQITAGSTTNFANDVKTQLNSNTVVSGSAQVVGILASLNTYTASNDTTNTTQNTRLTRLEESTASLNAFSASENTKSATLQTYTASVDTKFAAVQASTSSLNTFTASNGNTSLNSYTASNDTTNTAQNNRLSRLEESTASLNSLTSSYARTNSTNIFSGNQTITGSLFITQDLIVGGSSSIQNISASRLDIGDNIIQLNVNNPVLRFGGIAVFDSGSAGGSGSFLYDSVEDEFIFVHRGNGTNVTSSHFVLGPETYDNLGNETYLTNNRIPKGTGKEHLNDSNITDNGSLITLGSNTVVNGTIVASGTTLVSGSSQISHDSTTGYSANRHVDHTAVSITAGSGLTGGGDISATRTISIATGGVTDAMLAGSISNGKLANSAITIAGQSTSLGGTVTAETIRTAIGTVVTGSAQVIGILASLNTYTGSNDTTNTAQSARLSRLEESTSSINTLTASLATTYEGRASASKTLFSGSSQVSHDSTTGYSANRHIDHTAVSISAGSGLTGGGDISTTRTISIANLGVTDAMLAGSISNAKLTNSSITIAGQSTALGGTVTAETIRTAIGTVVTGSSQISHDSTTGYSANRHVDHTAVSITAGSGLTGGGDISTTRTISIANLGVTDAMLAGSISNSKLTNSSITIAGQSTALGGTVTAETIRTAIGTVITGSAQVFANVSGDVTIASNGVATIAANSVALGTDTTGNYMVDVSAGSGISITHTPGEGSTATITNSGVRSIAAGTGVSVSATTGDNCSIAIGQSVATSASPTFAGLTINGSITATGDITAYFSSDKRFKDNVQIIPDALSKVRKLNGVTWEWNDLVDDVTKQSPNTGLIAQEVQQVLPEVVKERGDGHLGLDYSKMMGLLVEAIKEQQNKIDNLSIEIENLKKQKGL